MKLLLDQGLPRRAAQLLREAGIDAVHTAECGLATALDVEILNVARQAGRVGITLDADLHAILSMSGAAAPSAIRIRIQGLTAEPLAELARLILDRCREDLEGGALVSVNEKQIRVRRLPIQPSGTR
jgi:predicted nuclease of predicted toxin-antitoxin system